MQTDYTRFAIYWVPRQGSALSDFGAGWTGWCADRGDIEIRPDIRSLTRGRKGVPGDVALHGIHANIKSPFKLQDPTGIWSLRHALARLAGSIPSIPMPAFEVTVFDGQVVLALTRPNETVVDLLGMVADIVLPYQTTPRYAALGEAGSGGSGAAPLPANRDWGSNDMPMIERFHMPLTDRLHLGTAYEVVADIEPILNPILETPQTLLDLALVGDPGRGRPWRLIERYPLSGANLERARPIPSGMACEGPHLITNLTDVAGVGQTTLIA